MLTNNTTLTIPQTSSYASNVLYYVILHGGPDLKMTNYASVRPYVIGRLGLLYPAQIQTTIFGASTGTNFYGYAAKLQGGKMDETNVTKSVYILWYGLSKPE